MRAPMGVRLMEPLELGAVVERGGEMGWESAEMACIGSSGAFEYIL